MAEDSELALCRTRELKSDLPASSVFPKRAKYAYGWVVLKSPDLISLLPSSNLGVLMDTKTESVPLFGVWILTGTNSEQYIR